MSPEQFASKFCLIQPPKERRDHVGRFFANDKSKDAAVLVPIIKRKTGLHVILTQRSMGLRHHPGQISFPGGRKDLEDPSLIDTALRETHEEIGVKPELITPLGWLPIHQTITNYTVYPLVALIENTNEFLLNPDEVNEIFEVPLNYFLKREQHHTLRPKWGKKAHEIHFIPYQDKLIWGATAAILDKLTLHFE